MSPEQVAAADAAPAVPNNVQTMTPAQMAAADAAPPVQAEVPGAQNVLRDMSVDQIVDLVKADPTFNVVAAFRDDPTLRDDPTMWAKAQEAYNRVKSDIGWMESTPVVSGLVAGDLGKTLEGVKQVGGTLAEMAKGGAKWIGNVAGVASGEVADAAATALGVDPAAIRESQLETQRRAAETIAASESGVLGLSHVPGQVLGAIGRATGIAKQFKDYTPAEKQQDFIDAVTRHDVQKGFAAGEGPLQKLTGGSQLPVRPEEVQSMAAGDPVSFLLFGAGMEAAGAAGKAGLGLAADIAPVTAGKVASLVEKLPDAADLAQTAGGRMIQGTGITASGALKVAEKTAPLAGAAAGIGVAAKLPILGEVPIASNLFGAAAGYKYGKAAATQLHKFGEGIKNTFTAAGKNIAEGKISGSYEQLAKDLFRAAPDVAGKVAHGAAFDLGLAASAETPEERQGVGMGIALGLAGGAGKTFRDVLSGQIIAPRWFAGNEAPRVANPSANRALVEMHNAAFPDLNPGQKVRVNSVQDMAKGISDNTDVFVAKDGPSAEAALVKAGIAPETASTWAQQRGMTFDLGGRKVVLLVDKPAGGGVSGIDSAPHEARHAMENVIGEDGMRQLDNEIKSTYNLDAVGENYANRFPPTQPGDDWHQTVLEHSKWGQRDAVEKMFQDALTQYHDEARNAGNEPPSDAEIRQLVNQQVEQQGVNWREILTPEEQQASAERYISREIAAENFDAWFKRTGSALKPGKQVPEVLARWIGNAMELFGGNPVKGKISEGLKIPLNLDIAKQTGEQATNVLPKIEPATAGTPAPRTPRVGGATTLPRTPAEVQSSAQSAATLAQEAPDVALPGAQQTQREILGTAAEAIAGRSGMKLNYLSAPDEPAAALSSRRTTRREMIELYRRMPEAARKLWEKTFFPETVLRTNDGRYQVQGWAPEVLAANAQKLAEVLAKNPDMAKLSPYAIDPATGSFTRDAWLDLYGDVQRFVENQMAGATGSGETLVVPSDLQSRGFFKPPFRRDAVLALDQNKSDFVNMLFNFKLPSTTKLGHGKFPLNIAGQEVSKATMPGRLVTPIEPRGNFEGQRANELGIEGRPILEVNPLRNQMEAAAKAAGVKMPSFIEVIQKLNLERILEAAHAPEVPQFRGNTLTLSAGFMPGENIGKREISIEGKDGKKYRAMFDGYQDFTSIGKGKFAQVTPLEDIPGVVPRNSTTYAPTLEKAGFKVNLDGESTDGKDFSKTVSVYSGSDGAISSWFTTNPDRARTYGGQTMKLDLPADVFHNLQEQSKAAGRPTSDVVVPHEWVKKAKEADLGGEKPPVEITAPEEESFWTGNQSEADAQFMPKKEEPKKTVTVYKLFGTRKSQPGKIFPLFIGAKVPTPMGEWIQAKNIPTKGFSNRPGWHVGMAPRADHLLTKEGKTAEGRVWAEAEIPADVDWQTRADASPTKDIRDEVPTGGHYSFRRPARQGGEWKIAGAIKVNRILTPEEVDAINSKPVAPTAQFMHSLEGIKKMNDEEVARQERAGETETSRLSSYTGDAEAGVVIHSAKNRSTAFIRAGKPSEEFLKNVESAKNDKAKNDVIEKQYASAQFMASGKERKSKPDYKLKEGRGMMSKAWLFPDGKMAQLGEQWHHDFLNENPDVTAKYGLKVKSKGEENRLEALQKGFARINYSKGNGVLTVEARKADWDNLAPHVREFVKTNLDKIDNMDVHLFDNKAKAMVDSDGVQLFTYDTPQEKMDNLPFLSKPEETTETSAQATPGALTRDTAQFLPGYKSKDFDKELEKVRSGENFGQTFNRDGTVWTVSKKSPTDVVTLASVNLPKDQLTRENIQKALGPDLGNILDEKGTALGVFTMPDPNMVSVDVNALVPQKFRKQSEEFAKQNNQVSIWDPVKGEEVKTGGTGETTLKHHRDILDALSPLLKGESEEIRFPDPAVLEQANAYRKAGKPIPTQVQKKLTLSQKAEFYPESVEVKKSTDILPSQIKNSPLSKQAGSEPAAIKAFSDRLVDMAKQYHDSPEFQEGLKWYSDFVPELKKEFGDHAQLFAELLAATSPRNKPKENFELAVEALEGFKTGKFDAKVSKFLDGMKMLEDGTWQQWYDEQLAAKKVKGNRRATEPAFMAQWIKEHDLTPRKSNEKLYGMHSTHVLKVLARTWLQNVTGPKVSNFIQNLVGTGHGATIDVWAQRTMRRLGYEGFQDRWRILPENEGAVADPDFFFSQKAFADAAERLGVLPDALQGGLWFAEKKHWADRQWGRLDLGSYLTEMKRVGNLREGVAKRLSETVKPRPEK